MKKLILILILALFFSGCKKDIRTFNLKGRIMLCFNGIVTPYANKPIDLFQTHNGGNYKSKVLSNTTTDAEGNFEFSYFADIEGDKLTIRESSGFGFFKIISGIPVQNLSDVKVYYAGRYNLVVGLNVLKQYTNMDTLFITNIKGQTLIKIAGPFTSGRVFGERAVSIKSDILYGSNQETLPCGLNSKYDFRFNKDFTVENRKLCGDTVYVNLDIR